MRKHIWPVSVTVGAMLAMTSCANPEEESSSGDEEGPSSDVEVSSFEPVPEVVDQVPAEYRERGSFTVAINPDVPPVKFVDNTGEVTGFNPELLRAAGQVMDLEVEVQQGSFDSMVPGLESERFDVIGSIGDFEERRSNIDFINYMHAGTGILAGADFEMDEVQPEELCGSSVGYVVGTEQQGLLASASNTCTDNGEDPISNTGYRDAAASVLAVESNQEDAAWIDTAAVLYNASENPEMYKAIYTDPDPGYYGMGVNNENEEFRDALRSALVELEENGGYEELMSDYGLTDEVATSGMPLNQGASIED